MQRQRGELEKAEASQTRALTIMEKAFGPDHPAVASTLTNLGSVQRDQHRFDEARGSYKRAAMIFAAKLGEQHPHTTWARRLIAEISGEGTNIEGGHG